MIVLRQLKGKDKKRNINTKRKTNKNIHSLTIDWIKGIKHKLNTDLKKTLYQLKPLSVWISVKINQLYMFDKPPIYPHNQSQLKRVLCVAVMQHCDINTTLSIFSCALIYTDKLIVMTVNY